MASLQIVDVRILLLAVLVDGRHQPCAEVRRRCAGKTVFSLILSTMAIS
jgi:hypothetical protein